MADRPPLRTRLRDWSSSTRIWLIISALVVLFLVVYFGDRIFYSVDSGHEGVLWRRFQGGTQLNVVYREGLHVVFPWNRFYIYDVRMQEVHGSIVLLSSDGVEINLTYSARFFPAREQGLPRLHQHIGPDYIEKVIRNEVVSALRRIVGNYTPEMIYARDEEGLLDEILTDLRERAQAHFVTFDQLLITEMRLPAPIQAAINDKLTQLQAAASYVYRIDRETAEAQRKEIEARGIQTFQQITGIPMLQWRGIDATVQLATSPNAKVILMGTGKDGLPVILNIEK
jgi:regulator of protease activity HflC (stomatin/prohibitin superfamily)